MDIIKLLLEEEEDDDLLLEYYLNSERASTKAIFKHRNIEGCSNVIKQHLNSDEVTFRNLCHLNKKQFHFILSLVNDELESKITRKCISAEEKLFLTLRFIATGETYKSLSFTYQISDCYISSIIRKVLRLLRQKLTPITMPPPTQDDYKRIEMDFWKKWNIPNCVSSINGKHVRIKTSHNSGSHNYNSVVMLGLVDANCKFVAVDAGSYGKEDDKNIFRNSIIRKKIANNQFNIPKHKVLPGSDVTLPYFLMGNKAFPLNTFMMKPYSNKKTFDCQMEVYNYRLREANRVAENAFGLLSQVFRVFYTPIAIAADTCTDLIIVACCLHNLLRDGYLEDSEVPYYVYNEETPIENMIDLITTKCCTHDGIHVRDELKLYFNSEYGRIPRVND